ncbi:MAG: hypothetical protein ACLP9K_02790 [Nitrososphaerales archaeon]
MYDSGERGHAGGQSKADRVAEATVKSLGDQGEILQSRLINAVAERLGDLDPNTVNGLVRKFLSRYNARGRSRSGMMLVELREEENPKRKYWKLTAGGYDYLFLKVGLHQFSKAFMKSAPEEYDDLIPFFYALSESEELAEKVETTIWGLRSMSFWAERWYAATIGSLGPGAEQVRFPRGIWSVYDLKFRLALSITKILAEDKSLRAKVGHDAGEQVRIAAIQLLEPHAKLVQEFDRRVHSFKDSLEKEWRT